MKWLFLCTIICFNFLDLWGPFLVICPASTLHNWQQEFSKFVPEFKVVPYWGNPAVSISFRVEIVWHHNNLNRNDIFPVVVVV